MGPVGVRLSIPRDLLRSIVHAGADRMARTGNRLSFSDTLALGVLRDPRGDVRLLAFERTKTEESGPGAGTLEVAVTSTARAFDQELAKWSRSARSPQWSAELVVGLRAIRGRTATRVRAPGSNNDSAPVEVLLSGPGMSRILFTPEQEGPPGWAHSEDIWSRSQGAIGAEVWNRLVHQHFTVVGAGRSGGLMAMSLANLGVRHLTLVDPDLVEPHNLDAGVALSIGDIGRPKAEAVASFLESRYPWTGVKAVTNTVASRDGIAAIAGADVVVSTVDSARSLLQTDALCTIYGKTRVTIGSRIVRDRGGLDVAAEVGLLYGGMPGCSICLRAKYPGLHAARKSLWWLPERPRDAQHIHRSGDFRTERMGSLLSLNQLACGTAVYALQSAFGGGAARSRGSYIQQLFYDADGQLQTRKRTVGVPHMFRECLCPYVNRGDDGMQLLREFSARPRIQFERYRE